MPWTVYLAIPISISPLLILLPCAVLLGVSVYITVRMTIRTQKVSTV